MRLFLHAVAALLVAAMAKDQPQNLEMKYEDPVDGPLRDMDLDLTMVIDEEIKKLMTPEQLEELENAAFQETIRQSRGERESQGVRDQWESKDGIGRKEDGSEDREGRREGKKRREEATRDQTRLAPAANRRQSKHSATMGYGETRGGKKSKRVSLKQWYTRSL